jgi:hypothetical protein
MSSARLAGTNVMLQANATAVPDDRELIIIHWHLAGQLNRCTELWFASRDRRLRAESLLPPCAQAEAPQNRA